MLKNNEEVIIGWQGNGVAPKRSQGTSDDCKGEGCQPWMTDVPATRTRLERPATAWCSVSRMRCIFAVMIGIAKRGPRAAHLSLQGCAEDAQGQVHLDRNPLMIRNTQSWRSARMPYMAATHLAHVRTLQPVTTLLLRWLRYFALLPTTTG